MFYFYDDKQLSVFFSDSSIAIWKADDPCMLQALEACKKSNWVQCQVLHNQAKAIMTNDVSVEQDKLIINMKDSEESVEIPLNNKESVKGSLVEFIAILKKKGVIDKHIEHIKPFLINMFKNKHINAVTELYDYCKAQDFEITEDGCFLAYKNVGADLGSIHDNGKTKHTIGQYTEVKVFDTDRRNHCSNGLHFCSKSYLASYSGDTTIIVKINPMDVVSIPTDYNFAKGRCSKYYVVGILGEDGTLSSTNIEAMSEGTVKVVKTKERTRIDKKLADIKEPISRIVQTVSLMKTHNNDAKKVASIMNITVSTVKRNVLKYKHVNN